MKKSIDETVGTERNYEEEISMKKLMKKINKLKTMKKMNSLS